jgi:chromosome segregation ATPase
MSMSPEQNGARPTASVQQLREQIAKDRRQLSETVTALHAKTDVKAQVEEKVQETVHETAAGTEMADADLPAQLGRTAHSAVRFGRWAAGTAVGQVRNVTPRPVREQAGRVGELVQRELRYVLAASAAAVVAVTYRWWRHGAR